MPVLVIETGSGLQGGLLQGARAVAEDVRGTTVESAGHYISEEQPAELVKRIRKFHQEY
jgi:pimeloyl-ACP methyl ester carboxylesterase